jgi:glycosyltransferase involved in cell wall biosynthesis
MRAPDAPAPILLAVQALTQGGSERQLAEIAKALDRRRFTPHVAVFRPGGLRVAELREAGVPVTCFPFPSFWGAGLVSAARRLGAYLNQHSIRLVHTFDLPANIFAVPVARWYGVSVVLSSQRAYRDLAPRHFRFLLRLTDRMVNGIVVNCRAIERHLIEEERIAAGRIRLCYNGIDTTVFRPLERRRPAELQEASLVVGVVCALRPEKGLPTLVRAFAQARAACQGMKLLLVGSGPALPGLEQLASRLGIRADCVFIPSTAAVTEWLGAVDIFVLPSLSEALSNSLMEAMACRCAVIASRVGGNPELVAAGERGLLFSPGDSEDLARNLRLLAANAELRLRLAEAGCRFIHDQFPREAAARRMADIYSGYLQSKQ